MNINTLIYIVVYFFLTYSYYANILTTENFAINIKYYIIIIFVLVYVLVILEEFIKIKKSKVVILGSTLIWILIFLNFNDLNFLNKYIKSLLLEYCELFLFLFVAMIYINSIKFFGFLNIIQDYIILKRFSYRKIFWITGFISFFLSPLADNLTTALFMSSFILAVCKNNRLFINITFINIIVASNAGGAFSPFGDITTLMIWQSGILKFSYFFKIFIPSFVMFFISALLLNLFIPQGYPLSLNKKTGIFLSLYTKILMCCFLITIILTVILQTYLQIPPSIGMMCGLGILQIFEFFNNRYNKFKFYINDQISKVEWDTLLFFYGIILCVGSLSFIGILNDISLFLYNDFTSMLSIEYKELPANIFIGILSAIIDNIPITFAVLNMNIHMSVGQWLLVTLTVATGGSLLSIGSAAGVALMGQNKNYTFFTHFKYSWIVFLGYICGILSHIIINNHLF